MKAKPIGKQNKQKQTKDMWVREQEWFVNFSKWQGPKKLASSFSMKLMPSEVYIHIFPSPLASAELLLETLLINECYFLGARFDDGSGGDNEVQRTMLELINQLDGFDSRGNIKVLMATNRPDTLDPALLRPGRLDRKVEFSLPDLEVPSSFSFSFLLYFPPFPPFSLSPSPSPLFRFRFLFRFLFRFEALVTNTNDKPKTQGRAHILKIHAKSMSVEKNIRYELIARLCPNSTGAEMRSVCTEAGMFAIRARRKVATEKDFLEAVNKVIKGYKKFSATPRYMTYN